MFGFHVPRTPTGRLIAQRVLDFWNRYFFYFKELMFDFFFLPTYLTSFRTRPRLRIVAAVMSAAFFGNFYFHFIRDQPFLGSDPPSRILALIAPRAVYTFLLGLGISGLMLRERARRGRDEVTADPSNTAWRCLCHLTGSLRIADLPGMPDLLIAYRGKLQLVEVKNTHGKLNAAQRAVASRVAIVTVRTIADALALIGAENSRCVRRCSTSRI